MDVIISKFNYWIYVVLMMIGLWAMIAKNNLIKKIVGMSIFQTAIILFYVSVSAKKGATIPVLGHAHGSNHGATVAAVIQAADYANPLPHVLMLTAIVVGVSTLGVALALVQKIYKEYGTAEEDEILEKLQ